MEYVIYHHGILGQQWGVRNGPPYPLSGGKYTDNERARIYKARRLAPNSIYNKKHFDETLKSGTKIATLSYDRNRTKNVDMFYGAHNALDKHQYNALFNKKAPTNIVDKEGNVIGTDLNYKVRINNTALHDIKVASEDSGIRAFKKLYSSDRDFYNFVNDSNRMESLFVTDKYKFRGYREARSVLNKMKNPGYTPTSKDLSTIYRMFNYVIPYSGDKRKTNDISRQRAKFFRELKRMGYGAVLDTNDAIYGGFKTKSPIILFDMEAVTLSSIDEIGTTDKLTSDLIFLGRKALGL